MKKPYMTKKTCSVCGCITKGVQWYNRDKGYGICPKCAFMIYPHTDPNDFESSYGKADINYISTMPKLGAHTQCLKN